MERKGIAGSGAQQGQKSGGPRACYAMLSHFSRVRLLSTPWTVAHQAPPSVGFSRQVYWSGVPLPSLAQEHIICIIFCHQSADCLGGHDGK